MMAWIKTVVVEVVRCGDEDSGCNLKVDLTRYANGLHIECDRRHIVKNDFKTLGLNKIEEWSCHLLNWGQTGEESGLWVNVTKRKFVCRSKQNIRIWNRKRLIEGPSKKNGDCSCSKPPNSWLVFRGKFFRQNLGWGLQSVWLSSDWLMERYQGSVVGMLCSVWSYYPTTWWGS